MRPLRYVILRHDDVPEPHFDLMFETLPGSELATWRCPTWPIDRPTPLTRLKDHRRVYLDYEGKLSGQRGRVHRITHGTCEVEIGEDALWVIRLATVDQSLQLTLRQIDAEKWEASQLQGGRRLAHQCDSR